MKKILIKELKYHKNVFNEIKNNDCWQIILSSIKFYYQHLMVLKGWW